MTRTDADSKREQGAPTLLELVRERTGVNLAECFQCQKCSGGCTMATTTDLLPHVLVRLVQLDEAEAVLTSKAIWLCVGCQTCTTRCPNELNLGEVMDGLRQIALESSHEPGDKDVAAFHRIVLDTVRRHGRLFELGMILRLKTETGQYTKDMGMGLELMRKGKIRLVACNVKNTQEIAELFEQNRDKG